MSAPEFFIDNDANGDPWVWAKNGDRPIQVLNLLHVAPEHAPLLDLIRAAVEGEVREEWGVRWPNGREIPLSSEMDARLVITDMRGRGVLLRRSVIEGYWEEGR